MCYIAQNSRNMKKLVCILLAAVFAFAAVSCKKDDPDENIPKGVDGVTPLPEAVDIGIISSGKTILWANFNLGASKETDYGDYYAWGETTTKQRYYSDTYTYSGNDVPAVIPADHDAAAVKLGDGWRIPTKAECALLAATLNDANYKWEYVSYGKQKHGIRITYLVNGKSIFIPCGGQMDKEQLYQGASCLASFWTSSRNGDSGIHFHAHWDSSSEKINASAEYNSSRVFGLNIRPVKTLLE